MDVNKLCRVCCSKKTRSQLEDIYVSIDSMYKNMRPFCLSSFMTDFFDIVISEDDNLPQNICKHCKKEVLQAYKLVKLCYNSDKKLRGLFMNKHDSNDLNTSDASEKRNHRRSYKLMIWKKKYEKVHRSKKKTEVNICGNTQCIKTNIEVKNGNHIDNEDRSPKNITTIDNIEECKTSIKVEYDSIFENDETECVEDLDVQNTIRNDDSVLLDTKDSSDGQYVKLLLKLSTANTVPDKNCSNIDVIGVQNIVYKKLDDHVIELKNINSESSDNCSTGIQSCTDKNNLHLKIKSDSEGLLNKNHNADTESNCSFDNYIDSGRHKDDQILDPVGKSYICNICGVTLCSKGSLQVHQVTHSSERPYACDKCDLKFKLKSHLIAHQRNIHEGVKKHFCKVCSKSFFGSAQLKFHVMTHTKEYPHLCTQCGKRFAQQGYLRVHQKIHTGIKDLKCDQCDYISGNKSSMKMHVKGVHEVDKKYQCTDCGLRFMYPSGLEKHMTIHTGIKKHTCAECQKTFRTIANLNDHKRIHSNEKPYNCRHCEKSFRMFTHRTTHERIHTGIKPYICVICTKGFQTRSNLNVHQKTHNKA